MTRKEAERQTRQADMLRALGFTYGEAEQLRRISLTLHRWYERECGDGNGCIERDGVTGRPMWRNANTGRAYPIADRERGAIRRLDAILAKRNARDAEWRQTSATGAMMKPGLLTYYLQTDPRGAALYIIRPGDVPDGKDVSSYYDRGICVY